jgi:hypothetical protein
VVECELLFGLVLLSGILPRLTWALSLLCFGGFALISLYKGISGESTCGCFGRVPVNPWYTFTLDAFAVLALLRWRPRGLPRSHIHTFSRSATVLTLWFLVGAPVALATWSGPERTLTDLGEVLAGGRIVILKPETWLGKRFPLLPYINTRDELALGEWTVVVYRHDCPVCRNVVSQLKEAAGETRIRQTGSGRVALIEMPPYGEGAAPNGQLRDSCEWFVRPPVVVRIRGGLVIAVLDLL